MGKVRTIYLIAITQRQCHAFIGKLVNLENSDLLTVGIDLTQIRNIFSSFSALPFLFYRRFKTSSEVLPVSVLFLSAKRSFGHVM